MSELARSISALGTGRILIRVRKARGDTGFDAASAAQGLGMDRAFVDELRRHARPGRAPIEWGEILYRPLVRLDNVTLCRQFGFDPRHHFFDLPSSANGTGSTTSGAGGSTRGRRVVSGFVTYQNANGGADRNRDPLAVVEFVDEGTRDRDVDPQDRNDFERL